VKKWLLTALSVVSLFIAADSLHAGAAGRYSDEVFKDLQKTRDALLGQRSELQRAKNETLGKIDQLNQKVGRIDQYLKQVDDSLRDVDSALTNY
jgi:hypothetical protein